MNSMLASNQGVMILILNQKSIEMSFQFPSSKIWYACVAMLQAKAFFCQNYCAASALIHLYQDHAPGVWRQRGKTHFKFLQDERMNFRYFWGKQMSVCNKR